MRRCTDLIKIVDTHEDTHYVASERIVQISVGEASALVHVDSAGVILVDKSDFETIVASINDSRAGG